MTYLVLLGTAAGCAISALTATVLPRYIARAFLSIAGILLSFIFWFTSDSLFIDETTRWGIVGGAAIAAQVLAFRLPLPTLNPSDINICLAHAHSFSYLGATSTPPENDYRIIDPEKPIDHDSIRVGINVPFAFGIDIGESNVGKPLFKTVRLNLNFTKEQQVDVTPEIGDGKPEHQWRCHATNLHYWYEWAQINERWRNTWTFIRIKFSYHGLYDLKFVINGDGLHKELERHVVVNVRRQA